MPFLSIKDLKIVFFSFFFFFRFSFSRTAAPNTQISRFFLWETRGKSIPHGFSERMVSERGFQITYTIAKPSETHPRHRLSWSFP